MQHDDSKLIVLVCVAVYMETVIAFFLAGDSFARAGCFLSVP